MQYNRRNLGLFIIIVGLVILISLIYFTFFRQKNKAVAPTKKQETAAPIVKTKSSSLATVIPNSRPRNQINYDISQEPAHKTDANDLVKISKAFAERFGSFSNQSNYGNLSDLKMFMTKSLQDWINGYIKKISKNNDNSSYYGITTKALTTKVKSFDDQTGTADIMVTTERSESTSKINGGTPYREDLELMFKKVNSDWLVDAVYWRK